MALIKCPHCGQTVLSIASQCPKCAKSLINATFGPGGRGELGECRECGRAILSRLPECPHCGARRPGVHYARGLVVAGGVVVVALGVAAMAFFKQPSRSSQMAFTLVSPAPFAAQSKAAPAVVLRTIDGPLRVRPKPIPAKDTVKPKDSPKPKENVDSSIARAREALAVASPPPAKPAPRVEPVAFASLADTQVKWTSGWANVRGSPHSDSQVVQVLRPGQQVAVSAQQRGWWVVLENGRQVGYVARQLLVDQPTEQ
jgi:hypothetical protein